MGSDDQLHAFGRINHEIGDKGYGVRMQTEFRFVDTDQRRWRPVSATSQEARRTGSCRPRGESPEPETGSLFHAGRTVWFRR